MPKIITDEKQIDEVLSRGVEIIYPTKEDLKKKLMSGERLRLYCGFDPSAPSLHIGNAIAINKLSQFQKLGHEVIFLIGDFTGMIGDPTDKAATRKKLTREEVLANASTYGAQAAAYLDFKGDNPVAIRYNSEWSDKLTFKDLIEISSKFTVQQMMQRDMFQERIKNEKPIHLHEFLYPLAQGYDSVAMDVDLEVGGNDQMFNMMAGRDLMKALDMKEKFVLTLKLIADDEGKKMGKSEGNAVFLDAEPRNIYGSIMSWPDGVLDVAFELCTKLPMEEVKTIHEKLKSEGSNPRDLKMKLAFEITKLVHGEEKAREAQDFFVRTVQNKELPEEIEEFMVDEAKWKLLDLLLLAGLVESKGEARRLIVQGGIKVNEAVIGDADLEVVVGKDGVLLQRGKRGFLRVVLAA